MIISLDMYQTLFAAVCVLMLGRFLKARIGFLEKFCIPAPVIGGCSFAKKTKKCCSKNEKRKAFKKLLEHFLNAFLLSFGIDQRNDMNRLPPTLLGVEII